MIPLCKWILNNVATFIATINRRVINCIGLTGEPLKSCWGRALGPPSEILAAPRELIVLPCPLSGLWARVVLIPHL
jgi:hypothetical protein